MIGEIKTNIKLKDSLLEKLKTGNGINLNDILNIISKYINIWKTYTPLFDSRYYRPVSGERFNVSKFNKQILDINDDTKILSESTKFLDKYEIDFKYYTYLFNKFASILGTLKTMSEYAAKNNVKIFVEDFYNTNYIDTNNTTAEIDTSTGIAYTTKGTNIKLNPEVYNFKLLRLNITNAIGMIDQLEYCPFNNAFDYSDRTTWSFKVTSNSPRPKIEVTITADMAIDADVMHILNSNAIPLWITVNDKNYVAGPGKIAIVELTGTERVITFTLSKPYDTIENGQYVAIFNIADISFYKIGESYKSLLYSTNLPLAVLPQYLVFDAEYGGNVDFYIITDTNGTERKVKPGKLYGLFDIETSSVETEVFEYRDNFYVVASTQNDNSIIDILAYKNAFVKAVSEDKEEVTVPISRELTSHTNSITITVPEEYTFIEIVGIYAFSQLLDKSQYTYIANGNSITITFAINVIGTINVVTKCYTTSAIKYIYNFNVYDETKDVTITFNKPGNATFYKVYTTTNGETTQHDITSSTSLTLTPLTNVMIITDVDVSLNELISISESSFVYSGRILTPVRIEEYISYFIPYTPQTNYGYYYSDNKRYIVLGIPTVRNLFGLDGNAIEINNIGDLVERIYIRRRSVPENTILKYRAVLHDKDSYVSKIVLISYGG